MSSPEDIPEEWRPQKLLFRDLETSASDIQKNVGCMGSLLLCIWLTLLLILWRIW